MALDLNTSPYYDDFDSLKNYFRILFNPGRAVQARELTQAQTILQNQMSTHASHIFKDGSPVIGAQIKVNSSKVSVTLNEFAADGVTPINMSSLSGKTLRKVDGVDADTGDKAVVTHVDETNRKVLIDYLGGDFTDGDKLVVRDEVNAIITDVVVSTGGIGDAITATINDGLFYAYGVFIVVQEETVVVDWNSADSHQHIGLQLTDSIVTSGDDATLTDPANGSYNFAAPGADRYKIAVTLSSYADGATQPDDFYGLLEINNGVVLSAVNSIKYADILDLLAKRTYDESGDYVVDPFEIFIDDDPADSSNYRVRLDPGLAYIKGYEVSTTSPTYLIAPKPRSTRLANNELIYANYGVFIDIDDTAGDAINGMFNIANRELVDLKTGINGTGRTIISTRVLNISRSPSSNLRVWLEWKPSLKDSLLATNSIVGQSSAAYANNIAYTDNEQPITTPLIFPLENEVVKDVVLNETIITVSKSYHDVVKDGGTGNFVILANDNTSDFVSNAQGGLLLVIDDAGNPSTEFSYTTTNVVDGPSTLTITPSGGLTSSATISVIAKLQRPTANPKTKTLAQNIYTFNSSGTSQALPHFDVFRITKVEVKEVGADDSTYLEVTNYKHNNNNTDVSYEYDSVSNIVDSKTYRVTYDYFSHSGSGDFFAINSYINASNLAYEPNLYEELYEYSSSYTFDNHAISDIIDFRRTPTDLASGVFIPDPQSNIFIDYNYYLPRFDIIGVDRKGNFSILKGIPSENPEVPEIENIDLVSLYELRASAYVKTANSIAVKEKERSNYTMDDIHGLEKRIAKLEYYTSLNLLEKQTDELNYVDSNGLSKFKNGIFVDNFVNFDNSNRYEDDFRSTIDPTEGSLRCPYGNTSIDYNVDTLSANLITTDDQIMFNYVPTTFINQNKAAGVTNLMPYDVVSYEGNMKLSPSSDTWVDNVNLPVVRTTIDNRDSALTKQVKSTPVWNEWQSQVIGETRGRRTRVGTERRQTTVRVPVFENRPVNFGGSFFAGANIFGTRRVQTGWRTVTRSSPPIRAVFNQRITTTARNTRTGIQMVPNDITTTDNSSRVVSRTSIPYMRSRTVSYDVSGLRPKTTHAALFGDTDVTAYCSSLTSDALGNLNGTFNLPGGTFTTGSKLFKLVDSDHGINPLSEAGATYTARGTLVKHQRTITTIRQTVYTARQVTQQNTTTTSRVERTTGRWYDPVAQSFLIENQDGGVFIDSVDLFFNSKNPSIPVQLYMVTMQNGYPTSNIIPGSRVTVPAANVTVSNDATALTNFKFDAPLHLKDDTDYAFVVMSNSHDYYIFNSVLGENDYTTGKRITEQPYLGSMFISQNASTWTPEQNKDVKFKINKCVFNTGTETVDLTNDNTQLSATTYVNLLAPNFEFVEFDGTFVDIAYKFTDESIYTSILNKENTQLSNRKELSTDGINNVKIKVTMTNDNPNVSPVLDKERLSSVIVWNEVRSIENPTTEESSGGFLDAGTYISKKVTLSDKSDDLRVSFDSKLPGGSRNKVYYRTSGYIPKYVEIDAASNVYDQFKNNTIHIYWYDSATGAWSEKSTAFVTKLDVNSSPRRLYLSQIADFTDFIGSADFATNSITDIFVSIENLDDTISNIPAWDNATTFSIGEYVFYNDELYVSAINSNLNNIPSVDGTAWDLIPTISTTSIIVDDSGSEWREMVREDTGDSSINKGIQFIEYTFVPDEYPDQPFYEFDVKIEMQSIDYTNIPLIQNLRAIALS